MKNLMLLAVLLAAPAAPARAASEKTLADAILSFAAQTGATKENPCLTENHQFSFFELLMEAVPVYSPSDKVQGKPPTSVILTMDRCDVLTKDHVEGNPMTPTAERWYTSGDWGVIMTTPLKSEKSWLTIVSKKNGAWTTAGQMGEFVTTDLFDILDKGKGVVKLAHYQQGGVELPYAVHLAFRPSWSR